ncbi:MAG: hypothetical protein O7E56_07230, partial [SAR324 cluster bacterium]|nr:hypothetical protein [SAR324 cluster bacterium]
MPPDWGDGIVQPEIEGLIMIGKHARKLLLAGLWALLAASLAACGSDSSTTTAAPSDSGGGSSQGSAPVLNMNFPASLTGAEVVQSALTQALGNPSRSPRAL